MASHASFHWDDPLLLQQQLSDDERRQRHRAVEVTIPLRNMLTI